MLDDPTADKENLLIFLHGGFEGNITSGIEGILFVTRHSAARILFVRVSNSCEGGTVSLYVDFSRVFAPVQTTSINFILAGGHRDQDHGRSRFVNRSDNESRAGSAKTRDQSFDLTKDDTLISDQGSLQTAQFNFDGALLVRSIIEVKGNFIVAIEVTVILARDTSQLATTSSEVDSSEVLGLGEDGGLTNAEAALLGESKVSGFSVPVLRNVVLDT